MNEWIFVKDNLPKTYNVIHSAEHGLWKNSKELLIATRNGGRYLGHLELTKYHEEYSEIRGWTPVWYVSSIGDGGIDCDGVEIFDVIAWMKIPKLPKKKIKRTIS